jgi:UDP-glucuronate 4-epimerase
MYSVLVTGGAGFIGTNLIKRLLEDGYRVTSIDNLDDYYSRDIKVRNSKVYNSNSSYKFIEADLLNEETFVNVLADTYHAIIHLAARPGVRFSIKHPEITNQINIGGTRTVISIAESRGIDKIIYASSSSVYGVNEKVPWTEESELKPISPYAQGKIECEKMGSAFAQELPRSFIALRFFSVYGKYARPDLAIGKFATRILNNQPIPVFGDGSFQRDFTHVDDIVDGIICTLQYKESGFQAFNLGNTSTNSVMDVVDLLEKYIGKKVKIEWLPVQAGDVPITYADITKARNLLNYHPQISLEQGLEDYVSHLKGEDGFR